MWEKRELFLIIDKEFWNEGAYSLNKNEGKSFFYHLSFIVFVHQKKQDENDLIIY